jgi:hypothetical protein
MVRLRVLAQAWQYRTLCPDSLDASAATTGDKAMSEYVYKIMCDRCNCLLGFWRYAGPFHGSMRCERCKDEPDEESQEQADA